VAEPVWTREVLHRLCAQYPRVPLAEVEALLDLWSRVLPMRGTPDAELRAAVESHVQLALHDLSSPVPQQRRVPNPVRTGAVRR
jgi:hypothetical protein